MSRFKRHVLESVVVQRARRSSADAPRCGDTSVVSHEAGLLVSTERDNGRLDRGWIGELDGLRALACLSVVLAHFNPGWAVAPGWSVSSLSRGLAHVSGAHLGVIFFYTLSAFLLTYLAVGEHTRSGTFDVKRFYVRRCLRIWPLYFTVVTVALWMVAPAAGTSGGNEQWTWTREHLWLFLGFVSNWSLALNYMGTHVDRSSSPLAILWSIAVEEQFYLVYPILILLALSSRRRARGILAALIGTALACRIAFLSLPVTNPSMGQAGGMYYATSTYLDVFAAGAAAGWLAARRSSRADPVGWLRHRGVGAALGMGLGVVAVTWGEQVWYPYSYATVAMYSATGVFFAILLLWTTVNHDAVVCRVLRSTPLRTLGVLSFGIYMWHPVAQALVNANYGPLATAPELTVELRETISFILYLGVSIGIAAVTYGLIERPLLSLKTRFAGSHASQHGAEQHPSPVRWGRVVAAAAVGAVLVEAALLAGFAGVARTEVGLLLPIGPRPPGAVPTTEELTRILDARVETAPGVNQFLIRAAEGSVDLARLGTIHTDLGYAVGVTLPGGKQIGFRYAPYER